MLATLYLAAGLVEAEPQGTVKSDSLACLRPSERGGGCQGSGKSRQSEAAQLQLYWVMFTSGIVGAQGSEKKTLQKAHHFPKQAARPRGLLRDQGGHLCISLLTN